jgi:hypothetical protein
VVAGIVVAGIVADGLGSRSSASSAAAAGVPFTDPSASGYIGLCDRAGHQMTSGSVTAHPFAWKAVSSVPALPPYDNATRTAILVAYQPRQGLVAGEWSGAELTASSRYSNPAHPMAAATGDDDSLADFTSDFHPVWNGYVQLRMYLGASGAEIYRVHYPTLVIQVSGSHWRAIGGGRVDCNAGTATSIETILLPKSSTSPPSSTSSTGPRSSQGTSSSPGGTSRSFGSPGQHAPGAGKTSTSSASEPGPAGSQPSSLAGSAGSAHAASHWLLLSLAALVLVALSVLLIRRSQKKGHQT